MEQIRVKKPNKRIGQKYLVAVWIVVGIVSLFVLFKDYVTPSVVKGECEIHFVDVGQGDCTVFQTEDATVVIDTGTGQAAEETVAYIDRLTDSIDYLILTHPHEDHIGGASAIIDALPVKNVLMTDAASDTRVFTVLLDTMEAHNVNVIEGLAGDSYSAGELEFTILAPLLDFDNYNNYSMVVRVDFGEVSTLVTGDAEKASDRAMQEKWGSSGLDCQIIKLAHHGSYTSTSKNFLEAASPQWAVISCGEYNSYGHPHDETLALLKEQNISYVRTDKEGSVVFNSNGKKVELIQSDTKNQ